MFYGRIKHKLDKRVQTRKTVRLDMRRLGNLYSIFLKLHNIVQTERNAADMFLRVNFDSLSSTIDEYSVNSIG